MWNVPDGFPPKFVNILQYWKQKKQNMAKIL